MKRRLAAAAALTLSLAVLDVIVLGGQRVVISGPGDVPPTPGIDCDWDTVQAAFATATAGATIQCRAGSWTWNVDTDAKVLWMGNWTLRGAGKDQTIITAAIDDGQRALLKLQDQSRITGIGFRCAMIGASRRGWRFDHNDVSCSHAGPGGVAMHSVYVSNLAGPTDHIKGLIDNNTFFNEGINVDYYPATAPADWDSWDGWQTPLGLGTDEAAYVEDNTVVYTLFGNIMDCQHAGRYVFRHNTVTDTYLETHGTGGSARGCRKIEIYENNFTYTATSVSVDRFVSLRGATGVIFNNTLTGPWPQGGAVNLDIRRTTYSDAPGGVFGLCDGTSPFDGNQDSTGWPCLDQIGRSLDTVPLRYPYPPYPVQAGDPLYLWNNRCHCPGSPSGGSPLHVSAYDALAAARIHSNRDYFDEQGAKPGYTAYTYPHPLQATALTTDLMAVNARLTRIDTKLAVVLLLLALNAGLTLGVLWLVSTRRKRPSQ